MGGVLGFGFGLVENFVFFRFSFYFYFRFIDFGYKTIFLEKVDLKYFVIFCVYSMKYGKETVVVIFFSECFLEFFIVCIRIDFILRFFG